jgi:hypothetical protein
MPDAPLPHAPGTETQSPGRRPPAPPGPVAVGDALDWLAQFSGHPATSLFCSLPDLAELSGSRENWEAFFLGAGQACLRAVSPGGLALFYQTDKRLDGRWISKAHLLMKVAEETGHTLIFHKIICRKPPGTVVMGRPGFAHLLAFSRNLRLVGEFSTPDVMTDPGPAAWSHGLGEGVARRGIEEIQRLSPETRLLLAPFSGLGEILLAAAARGLPAVGVERNRKRAEKANRRLSGSPTPAHKLVGQEFSGSHLESVDREAGSPSTGGAGIVIA